MINPRETAGAKSSPSLLSRRRMLKSLSALGLAGIGGLPLLPPPARAAAPRESLEETRIMLGTVISISLTGDSRDRLEEGMGRAFARMAELERVFSRHDASTPLSVLNARGSLADAPAELVELLRYSRLLSGISGSAFDVTVQPVIDLFRRYQNPGGSMSIPEGELREARAMVGLDGLHVDGRHVTLARQGMGLTLDGIAKGYIADEVSRALTGLGIGDHLVNAGGDIAARGSKGADTPWKAAVVNPAHPERHGRPFPLRDAALATSGSYRTYYDASHEHHHLVHPVSGASLRETASVSVLGKSAMEADALATALSVMPPKSALDLINSLPGRACLLITSQGRSFASRGWPASLA